MKRMISGGAVLLAMLSATSLMAQGRRGGGAAAVRDTLAASITDPRVGLHPGMDDAGVAAKNTELIGHRPKPDIFDGPGGARGLTFANSDLAFRGNFVYQGNFSGFSIWDISNPSRPFLRTAYYCNTGQGDPSIYGNLLFISSESTGDRTDCKGNGVPADSASLRMIGVRVFDVSDPDHPRHVIDLQSCRGSHTHTLVQDLKDKDDVYLYISGTAGVRAESELAGCVDKGDSANSAAFRIEIYKIPLAHPELSKLVSVGRVFEGLRSNGRAHGNPPGDTLGAGRGGRGGRGGRAGAAAGFMININGNPMPVPQTIAAPVIDSVVIARGGNTIPTAADSAAARAVLEKRFQVAGANGAAAAGGVAAGRGRGGAAGGAARPPRDPNAGPNQCHDITVYPYAGYAGGACAGLGLLLDIKDPTKPTRLDFVGDTNFSFWHSATFNNAGNVVVFTDEWGGGTAARCRAIDPLNWGGDAIFTIENNKLTRHAYFKMPAAQTEEENCVAHNGSLVPVPGRDIMVQGWYQGGWDMFDFTDVNHPREIAYYDRGPIPNHPDRPDSMSTGIVVGGYWCAYWYNGHVIGSEIARGIDVFDLTPSEWLSQNEIDAAKLIHMDQFNPQDQPHIVWPAAYPVVKSYLDQLVRDNGLSGDRTFALSKEIAASEREAGAARKAALTKIATELDGDARGAKDAPKVKVMAAAVRDLAAATK